MAETSAWTAHLIGLNDNPAGFDVLSALSIRASPTGRGAVRLIMLD